MNKKTEKRIEKVTVAARDLPSRNILLTTATEDTRPVLRQVLWNGERFGAVDGFMLATQKPLEQPDIPPGIVIPREVIDAAHALKYSGEIVFDWNEVGYIDFGQIIPAKTLLAGQLDVELIPRIGQVLYGKWRLNRPWICHLDFSPEWTLLTFHTEEKTVWSVKHPAPAGLEVKGDVTIALDAHKLYRTACALVTEPFVVRGRSKRKTRPVRIYVAKLENDGVQVESSTSPVIVKPAVEEGNPDFGNVGVIMPMQLGR